MSRISRIASLFSLLPAAACVDYPESVTDEDVLDQLVECQSNVALLQADLADMQASLATVQSQLDGVSASILTLESADATQDERLDSVEAELMTSSGLPRFIDADLTLQVPAEYTDVNAALDALNGSVISPAALVTVQIADGDYSYVEPIVVEHANGERIHIVGNASDPGAVTLDFPDGAVWVTDGHALGLLQGVTLTNAEYPTETTWGVLVERNAVATFDEVHVSGFAAGFYADTGAAVIADGTTVSGGLFGYLAERGAALSAESSSTDDNLYYGYLVERGATLDADYSKSSNAGRECYYAWAGTLDANTATADRCTSGGFVAEALGLVAATSASVTISGDGSTDYGYRARHNGVMFAYGAAAKDVEVGFDAIYGGVINAEYGESESNTTGFQVSYGGLMEATGGLSTDDGTSWNPATSASSTDGAYGWH